ncbi:MAG: NADH-quinone oxidoreductase subunit NuoN [Alphaproteobacteria bacterium]|nr:NADH-quinone oxidoreductase subunit NuoN [Alphaproteobacteria bacterium]
MSAFANDLSLAAPEIWLALAGMAMLMYAAFRGDRGWRESVWLAVGVLAVALVILADRPMMTVAAFDGLFVSDGFAMFMKQLVLIGGMATLVAGLGYMKREGMGRPEYAVLIVFATLGMMMMISANDLIALYVGLELQSLSLYVVASFQRDSLRSTEAGLKYFVLAALSSGMLLYGASLVYGFSGTTGFTALATLFEGDVAVPFGLVIGLVFVMAGLAFKVSAVPFHMWTPDVYEGAPTPVTAFFSVAPKIAAMALFLRVMLQPFGELVGDWQQIVIFIAIASMLLGAFAAIGQNNIKRLMAYSSISHVGYALVGLAAGTADGVRGVALYMAIYLAMNVGTFACILAMRRDGRMVETITDLAGLSRTRPLLALVLGAFMFSMAGIPPLAGFFGKLYVFLPAIEAGLVWLTVIGVLSSCVAAYYYLRIVKIMYFDEPAAAFDRPMGAELSGLLLLTGLFVGFFFLLPEPLLAGAEQAAAALMP